MTIVLVSEGSWTQAVCNHIERLGGEAVVVSHEDKNEIEDLLGEATHVVLCGGADIHPALYGEEVTHTGNADVERDAFENMLCTFAMEQGHVILGICRGCQMLAVSAGGTLWQDIEFDGIAGKCHRGIEHAVEVMPDTRFALIARHDEISVNSFHHQAVADMPDDWNIIAKCGDVTEGIEHGTMPWIGIQCHPEVLNRGWANRLWVSFMLSKPKRQFAYRLRYNGRMMDKVSGSIAEVRKANPRARVRKTKRFWTTPVPAVQPSLFPSNAQVNRLVTATSNDNSREIAMACIEAARVQLGQPAPNGAVLDTAFDELDFIAGRFNQRKLRKVRSVIMSDLFNDGMPAVIE